MAAMFKITLCVLLCLMLVGVGCNSATPMRPTVQPSRPPLPLPTAIDRGLIYGTPCNPPCWEGITPGITSTDEMVRIFEQLEAEGRIKSYWKLTGPFYLAEFPSGGTVDVLVGDGYVHSLSVSYMGAFDYRVRQVIERFGEPEAYAVYSNLSRQDHPCETWDESDVYTHPSGGGYLLYPSQGVTVRIRIPDGYTGCVCPAVETAVFHYYQPRSLTDALQEGASPAFDGLDWNSEHLVQWHGYGCGY